MTDTIAELNDSLIGRYLVEKEIGQGGMATVYLARDVRHDRKVAIKVIHPELAAVLGPERFITEMKVTANLQHPHILPLFDSGTARNQLFYVMPFVEGESLRDKLAREQQLPIDEAVRIATEVAGALDYAHRHGVVHRDIKPENILLHDGTALVADFGIALAVSNAGGQRLTQTGLSLGTPQYMSPEQATGDKTIDGRTDVYSLGCMLYEMLTGEPPFTGPSSQAIVARVLTEPVRPIRARRDTVSQGIEDAVLKAVQKLPADRFPTPNAFAEALRRDSRDEGRQTRSGFGARRTPLGASSSLVSRVSSVVVVAAIVGVAAFLLGRRSGAGSSDAVPEWSGELLGGPVAALYPKVSPDGQSVAFSAIVDGQTQVAVLNQRTGDWRVLTSDRTRGLIQNYSWTQDNSKLYFDRFLDVPKGVFSISPLGTGERLVLEDAGSPSVMPDGSLMVTRMNADGNPQMFHFWPENGKLDTLPVLLGLTTGGSAFVVFPDGKEAAFFGRRASQKDSTDQLSVINISTRVIRPLGPAGWFGVSQLAATPDNRWVVIKGNAGNLSQLIGIARDGSGRTETFANLPEPPVGFDIGRDGSLYFDQWTRQSQLIHYSAANRKVIDSRAVPNALHGNIPLLTLPDGRVLIEQPSAGATRVMVMAPGKEAVPFMGTDEATSGPFAPLGPDRIALMLGAGTKRSVAVVSTATGQLAYRIAGLNPVSMAASLDGKTLYYVESRTVWSMPSEGGKKATKIRDGDAIAIDMKGQYLVVAVNDKNLVHLLHVPLDGTKESEIPVHGDLHVVAGAALTSNSVAADGRILIGVTPPSSWFWPMAILDPRTGSLDVLPPGNQFDMANGGWTSDGHAVYVTQDLISNLWRYRPVTASSGKP